MLCYLGILSRHDTKITVTCFQGVLCVFTAHVGSAGEKQKQRIEVFNQFRVIRLSIKWILNHIFNLRCGMIDNWLIKGSLSPPMAFPGTTINKTSVPCSDIITVILGQVSVIRLIIDTNVNVSDFFFIFISFKIFADAEISRKSLPISWLLIPWDAMSSHGPDGLCVRYVGALVFCQGRFQIPVIFHGDGMMWWRFIEIFYTYI